MEWTNKRRIVWTITMVIFASINVLSTKWTDKLTAKNREGKDVPFNHPFLQACAMFLSEIMCYIVYKVQMCCEIRNKESETTRIANQRWNPIVFLGPALCDVLGTPIMYIGLYLTYVSSFQMLKGAVIVFTGLLSMAFLGRRFKLYEWLGIFVVVVGLVCTGIADANNTSKSENSSSKDIITGDVLIIIGQLLSAIQMVLEEKFLTKYDIPVLQGVGWEGIFGFVILSFLLIPMYFIKVGNNIFDNPGGRMEDVYDGFVQMYNNPLIIVAITGQMAGVAVSTYAGINLLKEISASNKIILDNLTTLSVWIFTLSIGWEKFHYHQLVVFLILFCGMCIYYDLLFRPFYTQYCRKCCQNSEDEPLLGSSRNEETRTSTSVKTGLTIVTG